MFDDYMLGHPIFLFHRTEELTQLLDCPSAQDLMDVSSYVYNASNGKNMINARPFYLCKTNDTVRKDF